MDEMRSLYIEGEPVVWAHETFPLESNFKVEIEWRGDEIFAVSLSKKDGK